MVVDPLIAAFPNLQSGYWVTSAATSAYNCIAWAAGHTDRWWWPHELAFWPPGVPRQETVEAFVRAYQFLGFDLCADASLEPGVEKVALYADAGGGPKHAARQLPSGRWTSKLGREVDIEHVNPEALSGNEYGAPVVFLKRPLRQ